MRKTALLAILFVSAFAVSAPAANLSGKVKNIRDDRKTMYLETENGVVKVKFNEKTKWPSNEFKDIKESKGMLVGVKTNDKDEALEIYRV